VQNRCQHNERGRCQWIRGRGTREWEPEAQAEGVGGEVRGRYGSRQEESCGASEVEKDDVALCKCLCGKNKSRLFLKKSN
jgi:hypothetical protein